MKKILASVFITLLLLIVLAGAGLYWALQGQYASELINRALAAYSDYPITVRTAKVRFPNYISLQGITIQGIQTDPLEIDHADIWVNTASFTKASPIIDSVLLNGLNLQHGLPEQLPKLKAILSDHIQLHQIAFSNVDYSNGEIIIRDGSIQIKAPRFDTPEQQIPFGTIQFSAEQVYWQGEAVNNLLIDGDYLPHHSIIYGLSFNWRGGKFSGQAEQLNDGWSLVNATIDSLRLPPDIPVVLSDNRWNRLLADVSHINSLDILNSSLLLDGMALTNLDLSAENLNWPFNIQTQTQGYLSLNAESIRFMNQLWMEPTLELLFRENSLQLNDFSTGFREGQIRAKGEFSTNSAHFADLNISGVQWIAEEEKDTQFLWPLLSDLSDLSIDTLNIKHSQFIQLAKKPSWQVSGLSVEGQKLELIRKGKRGIWNGKLTLSANNASFDDVVSDQPILRMESQDGKWRLSQAVLPLENGLLEAWGQFNFQKPSQPWKLEISADGLPFRAFSPWVGLPVKLDAITEFQLIANGLAGDELMLQHSLSGLLKGSVREAKLTTHSPESGLTEQPIEASEIRIKANRGQITFEPVTFVATTNGSNTNNSSNINNNSADTDDNNSRDNSSRSLKGSLMGELDLVHPQDGSVQLKLTESCSKTTFELVSDAVQQTRQCSETTSIK